MAGNNCTDFCDRNNDTNYEKLDLDFEKQGNVQPIRKTQYLR